MRNVIVVLTSMIMLSMFLANVLNTDGKSGTGTTTGPYVSVADSYDDLMWFIQITDIHISIFNDPERIVQFREFCDLTLRSIEPTIVLASGDLTDAKTRDSIGSEQFEDEWKTYRDALLETRVKERTVWLDIRGNHDIFNVAGQNSEQNFFTKYSVQGEKHPRSYMYQVKRGHTVYSFIGIDACLEPGPRRPFNFVGTLDDVETTEIESLVSQAESSLSNYTIFFGHFPSSCILHLGSGRHLREMIGGHDRGMAYLCGHLHQLGGLLPQMYTRQDAGFLELELGDWKDNRVFRLLAFDHGLFSFVDVQHRDWPVILVTNPKHALFVNTARENLSNMRNSTHIRILAFSLAKIDFVRVKVNDGIWVECRSVNGPLYVAKWNAEEFLEGMQCIEVHAQDVDGRSKYIRQPFALDGVKLNFGLLSKIALRTNASLIFRLMFFITLIILVLPLLLLRYFHYLVTAGKLKKPRPRRSCWFGVFRKLWILSTVDKLFIPIVLYPIYLTVGPWSIGYLVEDHIGAIFAWGILVNGAYLPGAFTYAYGFVQLITFQLPLTFILANVVNYRFERLTTQEAFRSPSWVRQSLFHTPFAITFTLHLVMAYLFWLAYGTMAFLLGPLRTWSLLLAAYMYYAAITLSEKSVRRATEVWHVTADVSTPENVDTVDREK